MTKGGLRLSGEAASPWAGSEQGRSPLSLCQSVPTTSSSLPLFFLSPEEKNKEKDKAGDNSTDTTQGTLCVRTGELESSHLNFQFCAPFSTPISIQLCYLLLPMLPGIRERTTERQGFLGTVRPGGDCWILGVPSCLQNEVKAFSCWNAEGRSQSHSRGGSGHL